METLEAVKKPYNTNFKKVILPKLLSGELTEEDWILLTMHYWQLDERIARKRVKTAKWHLTHRMKYQIETINNKIKLTKLIQQ